MGKSLIFFQYYAFDWLAMFFMFFGIWLVGSKNKIGFILTLLGNCCWAVVGVLTGSFAMVLANLIFGVMNTRGFISWSKIN